MTHLTQPMNFSPYCHLADSIASILQQFLHLRKITEYPAASHYSTGKVKQYDSMPMHTAFYGHIYGMLIILLLHYKLQNRLQFIVMQFFKHPVYLLSCTCLTLLCNCSLCSVLYVAPWPWKNNILFQLCRRMQWQLMP